MSYLRGENYIWSNDRFHLWIGDGFEDISEMEWVENWSNPGAVSISKNTLDQFVVMRFAELLFSDSTRLLALSKDIASNNGNFGAQMLSKNISRFERLVAQYGCNV